MRPALQDAAGARPAGSDRVRAHSAGPVNRDIDVETVRCLEHLASADREAVGRHIDQLEREWDVERWLQSNAAILSLGGVILGAAVDRRFIALPAVVFGFLFQHGVHGWCPPLPVFRRMGVRTRREINRERYALKALRGDFDSLDREL